MQLKPAIRLHTLILPVMALAVLQAGGCSRDAIKTAPTGGTYLSQSAGASFDQSGNIEGQPGEYIAAFNLAGAYRAIHEPSLIAIAAGSHGIVVSTNNGMSWTVVGTPLKTTNDVVVLRNGTYVISGTDNAGQGFVLRSLDEGQSWQSVLTIPVPQSGRTINLIGGNTSTPSILVALTIDPFDLNHVYAGSNLGTIFSGEQSAKVWRTLYAVQRSPLDPVQDQATAGIRALVPSPHTSGELLVITGDRRLLKIKADKEEEIKVPTLIGEPAQIGFGSVGNRQVYDVSFIPGFPAALLVGVQNGAVVTRDGGQSWIELKVPVDAKQKFNTIATAVSPTNTNRILVAINSVIYRSEDGGQTWNTYALGLPNHWISYLSIDPSNASRVLLVTVPANS